jgi:hypothetical protein
MSPPMRVASAVIVLALVAIAGAAPTLPPDLPAGQRARLDPVANAAAVSTRVDAEPFVGRPDVFEFLLNHPEFASRVTRVLRVARYRIWREPEGLWLDDGWGTVGRFDIVYAVGRTRVMHARGVYSRRLLPDIRGEAIVMIEYDVRPAPEGRSLIAATVTGFVKLDSGFLSGATNVLGPIAQRKADHEARVLMRVFSKVSRAADEQPAKLCQDLAHQPDVAPGELAAFCRLVNPR